jgi:NAD(P)-dependent dehydrogenase (short-subunit alcohol dehydrogenase family)
MAEPASDELAGAVAIVTGAAGGVGRATVGLLRARGTSVVAEDLEHHHRSDPDGRWRLHGAMIRTSEERDAR